ncbi:LysM peptidoglycan-binding domain-containing protein [Salinicola rhizosphaerae]|uniref:Peptidoglycan-binding protein n=1 Tax=Salinicola rhizosphaerae TaxID=1443141 RepID=A0ABQ3E6B8_9GAMM|nr:LysM domain-containing protein [Salinicola rhizosphaerae]GHB22507.1 peptidoglycan-binding protein [Salinicola rhizosphaerae]
MIRSNRVTADAGGRGWRLALMGAWLIFLAWPGVSWALALKPGAPAEYRVQPGDTLWSIAARYLDSPWQWRELWRHNPQLDSPTQLYPGDVITLTIAAGDAPTLDLQRGRGQTVRLSPTVRRAPTREAVPSLPLDRVKVFLDAYQIVDPARLENAPTVVAGQAQRLLSGAGDTLYAHGDLPAAGSRLGVYRVGNDYHAPGGEASLGFELHRLGHASVVRNVGDVGELEVLDAVQEIRGGDLLMALDEGGIATRFLPRAPEMPLVATILSVPSGVRFIGRNDVVAIDRGRDDGVEVGHVLQVMRQGERVHDDVRDTWVTLPDTEAGAVMVFRVFDHVSYALVMRASQALAVGDRLVVPADLRDAVAGGSER